MTEQWISATSVTSKGSIEKLSFAPFPPVFWGLCSLERTYLYVDVQK